MPKISPQTTKEKLGAVPILHSVEEARAKLRCGLHKWYSIRGEIDEVQIGGRVFYTDEALAAYVKRRTRRAKPKRTKASD